MTRAALGAIVAHHLAVLTSPGERQSATCGELEGRRAACRRCSQRLLRLLSPDTPGVDADLRADLCHFSVLKPHDYSACRVGCRDGTPWISEIHWDYHRRRRRWLLHLGARHGTRRRDAGVGIAAAARWWGNHGLPALCGRLRIAQQAALQVQRRDHQSVGFLLRHCVLSSCCGGVLCAPRGNISRRSRPDEGAAALVASTLGNNKPVPTPDKMIDYHYF